MTYPRGYTIRIQGHLNRHWADWFDGMEIIHQPDGVTTLEGVVTDQASLFGLLLKIRDLGISLIAVEPHEQSPAPSACHPRAG